MQTGYLKLSKHCKFEPILKLCELNNIRKFLGKHAIQLSQDWVRMGPDCGLSKLKESLIVCVKAFFAFLKSEMGEEIPEYLQAISGLSRVDL